jgi:hypothetical protein
MGFTMRSRQPTHQRWTLMCSESGLTEADLPQRTLMRLDFSQMQILSSKWCSYHDIVNKKDISMFPVSICFSHVAWLSGMRYWACKRSNICKTHILWYWYWITLFCIVLKWNGLFGCTLFVACANNACISVPTVGFTISKPVLTGFDENRESFQYKI